jgi:hypothetical protein
MSFSLSDSPRAFTSTIHHLLEDFSSVHVYIDDISSPQNCSEVNVDVADVVHHVVDGGHEYLMGIGKTSSNSSIVAENTNCDKTVAIMMIFVPETVKNVIPLSHWLHQHLSPLLAQKLRKASHLMKFSPITRSELERSPLLSKKLSVNI